MTKHLHPIWTSIACAAVIACGLATGPAANAAVILSFGQSVDGATVTATNNSNDTTTTVTGTNISVIITQYLGGGAPISGFLNFDLLSTGPASLVLGQLLQPFDGSFSFTSQAFGGGINYLSSTFTDFVFGINGGSSLTLNSSEPPGSDIFTSDILNVSSLGLPRAISLAFADVTPPGTIEGTTLAAFTSSVSGTISAGVTTNAPEPGSLMLLGVGLIGIGTISTLKRRSRTNKMLTSTSDPSTLRAA